MIISRESGAIGVIEGQLILNESEECGKNVETSLGKATRMRAFRRIGSRRRSYDDLSSVMLLLP